MIYQRLNDNGFLLIKNNQFYEAELLFKQALDLKPNFVDALNNLGFVQHKLGKLDQAIRSYKKVVSIDKNYALASKNKILRVIYFFSQGSMLEAVQTLEILIEKDPIDALLYNMLGGCFVRIGRPEMAIINYQKALEFESNYAVPRHMLNSLTGYTSKAPPKEYVKNLFDDYALRFNDSLVNDLQYNLPFVIKELVLKINSKKSEYINVVDLGCGTGLAAKNLRDISKNLTGIDISENMVLEAKKLDIYDTLINGEIAEELSSFQNKFDLLIALDVFIYIGDVQETFLAVRKSCKLDSLFIFSVEIQDKSGYSLLKSSRYSHSDRYIMEQTHGLFEYVDSQPIKLRKEADNWIEGRIYAFRPC
jgi:predicted TPR repeat methyltransferase